MGRKCEDNIRMDLKENGGGRWGVGWFHLVQNRGKWRVVVKRVVNIFFNKLSEGDFLTT